ncbi:MAG TPA: AsmA family protein, partial [Burkholderiaceae bacterium]
MPKRSRWWRIGLVALGAAMLLLAVGYVALTRMFPPARLAEMLANEVQAATGRELRIDGGLSFRLLPTIAVVADDVAFGNAAWGSRKDMATVKHAAFEVAVVPLLRGRLHVLSVAVDGADVLLETDERGRPNWLFAGAAQPAAAAASEPGGQAVPPPVNLDRLQLSDSRIAYRIGLTRVTHTVQIKSLSIVNQGEQSVLSAQFEGGQQHWKLDGKTGRHEALMRGQADWPFEVQLAGDGARLTANGSLDVAGTLRASVTARLDKAAALAPLVAGAAALPLPIEASAKLQRTSSTLSADTVQLSIAGQTLSGRATVRTDRAVPQIALDIAADSIDLTRWGIGKAASTAAPAARGPFFADAPLPVVTLPPYPLHANVRIDRLLAAGLPPLSAFKAEVRLEPGRLVVDPLSMGLAGGRLQGRLELGSRSGEPLRVKLRAHADGLSLQALDALGAGGDHVRGGRAELHADLEASGHTPHGLASSASGSVLLSVSDAALLGGAAAIDRNIVVALLRALLPKQEADKALHIECAVINLPLRSGVAQIDRSIALETDKLAVAASGELNLLAQTVALSFRPAVKKGIGLDSANLASLVMLEGPLHDPKIRIDMKGTAREAATIGAAVATAGLTLVGK